MALLEKLQELEKLTVCDKETVEALNVDHPIIEEIIDGILLTYKRGIEIYSNEKPFLNTRRITIGSKLLFLEDLLNSNSGTNNQIMGWLKDKKRKLLFANSEDSNTYEGLLVAKSKGILEDYRKDFNPNSQPQSKFIYEETLDVEYTVDIESIEKGRELIEKKVDKVLDEFKELFIGGFGYVDEEKYYDPDYVIKETMNSPDREIDEGVTTSALPDFFKDYYRQLLESEYITLEDYEQIEEGEIMQFSFDKSDLEMKTAGLRKAVENIRNKMSGIENINEKQRDKIKRAVLNKNSSEEDEDNYFEESEESDWIYKQIEDKGRYEYKDIMGELKSLSIENSKINDKIKEAKKLSSKYKNPKLLKYTIELSEKDPLDVSFGNDSGCCVGVYPNPQGNIGNGQSVSYYIADNATYIFNINQQRGEGKKRRTGIVLAFESKDDLGNRILACNSIELSPAMNPHSCIDEIIDFTEESLREFGKQNKFQSVIMSTHEYNTSYNHSKRKSRKPKREEVLTKINPNEEREFYSEIVSGKNINVGKDNFYLIHERRKFS